MSKTETYRKWTADEVEFLHENYDAMTAQAIARELQRTPDSVWEKSGREGLRKHAKRHARNEEGPWHCPKCNKDKPKDDFGKGSGGRGSAYCTACTNRTQNERRREKRK